VIILYFFVKPQLTLSYHFFIKISLFLNLTCNWNKQVSFTDNIKETIFEFYKIMSVPKLQLESEWWNMNQGRRLEAAEISGTQNCLFVTVSLTAMRVVHTNTVSKSRMINEQ
jgi:hypothetical protein